MKSDTFKNWPIGIGCALAIAGIFLGTRADAATKAPTSISITVTVELTPTP